MLLIIIDNCILVQVLLVQVVQIQKTIISSVMQQYVRNIRYSYMFRTTLFACVVYQEHGFHLIRWL